MTKSSLASEGNRLYMSRFLWCDMLPIITVALARIVTENLPPFFVDLVVRL